MKARNLDQSQSLATLWYLASELFWGLFGFFFNQTAKEYQPFNSLKRWEKSGSMSALMMGSWNRRSKTTFQPCDLKWNQLNASRALKQARALSATMTPLQSFVLLWVQKSELNWLRRDLRNKM